MPEDEGTGGEPKPAAVVWKKEEEELGTSDDTLSGISELSSMEDLHSKVSKAETKEPQSSLSTVEETPGAVQPSDGEQTEAVGQTPVQKQESAEMCLPFTEEREKDPASSMEPESVGERGPVDVISPRIQALIEDSGRSAPGAAPHSVPKLNISPRVEALANGDAMDTDATPRTPRGEFVPDSSQVQESNEFDTSAVQPPQSSGGRKKSAIKFTMIKRATPRVTSPKSRKGNSSGLKTSPREKTISPRKVDMQGSREKVKDPISPRRETVSPRRHSLSPRESNLSSDEKLPTDVPAVASSSCHSPRHDADGLYIPPRSKPDSTERNEREFYETNRPARQGVEGPDTVDAHARIADSLVSWYGSPAVLDGNDFGDHDQLYQKGARDSSPQWSPREVSPREYASPTSGLGRVYLEDDIVLRQLGLNNTFKTIELNGSTVAEVERLMLKKMSTALTEAQLEMLRSTCMNYHLHEAREGEERMMGKTEEVLWDRDRRLIFKADGTPVRIHIQSSSVMEQFGFTFITLYLSSSDTTKDAEEKLIRKLRRGLTTAQSMILREECEKYALFLMSVDDLEERMLLADEHVLQSLRAEPSDMRIIYQPVQSVKRKKRRPRSVTAPLRAPPLDRASRPMSAIGGWAATLHAHGSSDDDSSLGSERRFELHPQAVPATPATGNPDTGMSPMTKAAASAHLQAIKKKRHLSLQVGFEQRKDMSSSHSVPAGISPLTNHASGSIPYSPKSPSSVSPISVSGNDEWVILNVGGYRYETYVSTLGQFPGTMFGRMFDPKNRALLRKDHKGEYLIDRNGRVFEGILEFLRTGRIFIPPGVTEEQLAVEFDYFQLPMANDLRHLEFVRQFQAPSQWKEQAYKLFEEIQEKAIRLIYKEAQRGQQYSIRFALLPEKELEHCEGKLGLIVKKGEKVAAHPAKGAGWCITIPIADRYFLDQLMACFERLGFKAEMRKFRYCRCDSCRRKHVMTRYLIISWGRSENNTAVLDKLDHISDMIESGINVWRCN